VIAIETSAAAVTVSFVDPLTVPEVAVMLAEPTPTLCASPAVLGVLLIVAVETVSEDHVAVLVRFCVLPSVNVPVAVNCCIVPNAIDGVAGVTAIETNVAAVTVTVVDPLMEPVVAVMVAVPSPTLVANPCVGAVLPMVPTDGVSELHCTVSVMFCVLLLV
jgi:hypothetical protein